MSIDNYTVFEASLKKEKTQLNRRIGEYLTQNSFVPRSPENTSRSVYGSDRGDVVIEWEPTTFDLGVSIGTSSKNLISNLESKFPELKFKEKE